MKDCIYNATDIYTVNLSLMEKYYIRNWNQGMSLWLTAALKSTAKLSSQSAIRLHSKFLESATSAKSILPPLNC